MTLWGGKTDRFSRLLLNSSKATVNRILLHFFTFSLFAFPLCGDSSVRLQSDEPNLIGYRFEDDDVGHMDFKLSLKYPLFHRAEAPGTKLSLDWDRLSPRLYFAFTGRFAQYIGTRDSSPVISKRFNPKLISRLWLDEGKTWFDLAYEHESNGQSINTAAGFSQQRTYHQSKLEDPNFAKDSISRGWDFISATLEHKIYHQGWLFKAHWNFRHFLKDGLLQGAAEELWPFENVSLALSRRNVDGISFGLSTRYTRNWRWIQSQWVDLYYTTGTTHPFRRNTLVWTLGLQVGPMPVAIWGHHGYLSDLAAYHESSNAYGISFSLQSFLPWSWKK